MINITFASYDPQKGATITNAVADFYLERIIEKKLSSAKIAGKLLQDRLVEMRHQLKEAERALQEFKAKTNVVTTGQGAGRNTIQQDQLTSISTQLTNARVAMVEAKARLDVIKQMAQDGPLPRMQAGQSEDTVIARLQTQFKELQFRKSEIESRVGAKHDTVVGLRKRIDEVRQELREESKRIASSYGEDYRLAQERHRELSAAMNELAGEARASGPTEAKLRELENAVEALRLMHDTASQRLNESLADQQQKPLQDATIITRATPQLKKSKKKALAIFGGSTILGLLLGLGTAIGREWLAGVFRTPAQVKQSTGHYCIVVPQADGTRSLPFFGSKRRIEEFVLDAPFSRFTEALRNVKLQIDSARRRTGDKVFCVVSSVPKEGKTTISSNLAAIVASQQGIRTLLIDGDVHSKRLTSRLAADAETGLLEALEDPEKLSSLVRTLSRSNVDILPCAHPGRVPNAADLLGSEQMERLLAKAKGSYDCIIMEIAPVISVVDVKSIERLFDRCIFIIEWGQTKQRLVLEALDELGISRDRLLCCILNKADPSALRRLESYKGSKFDGYYEA